MAQRTGWTTSRWSSWRKTPTRTLSDGTRGPKSARTPLSEHYAKSFSLKGKGWCARRDSNAGPLDPESNALSGLSYGRIF